MLARPEEVRNLDVVNKANQNQKSEYTMKVSNSVIRLSALAIIILAVYANFGLFSTGGQEPFNSLLCVDKPWTFLEMASIAWIQPFTRLGFAGTT